jgi:hypothetical protein
MVGVSYAVDVLGISYLLGMHYNFEVSVTFLFDMLLTTEWSVGKKEQVETKDDF